jgi:hypothetical protein
MIELIAVLSLDGQSFTFSNLVHILYNCTECVEYAERISQRIFPQILPMNSEAHRGIGMTTSHHLLMLGITIIQLDQVVIEEDSR